MPGGKASSVTKKQSDVHTMEVPKSISVRVRNGIIESADGSGMLNLVFRHLHESLNDRNSLEALKALAEVHGFEVEVVAGSS